jgi:hypothetical protein
MLAPTREGRDRALDRVLADAPALSHDDARLLVLLSVNARQAQAPAASVDALRALCRHPAAAVEVLAACYGIDEIAFVLGLQNELPFMWSATFLLDWRAAFAGAQARARELVAARELPPEFADTQVATVLGWIVDHQPGLRLHVFITLLTLVTFDTLDQSLIRRLSGTNHATPERIAGDLVTRRADGVEPPRGLGLAASVPQARTLLDRFDARFADVIAAPIVAARMAAGRSPYGGPQARSCRTAWVYDRDYFEAGFLAALQEESKHSEGAIT